MSATPPHTQEQPSSLSTTYLASPTISFLLGHNIVNPQRWTFSSYECLSRDIYLHSRVRGDDGLISPWGYPWAGAGPQYCSRLPGTHGSSPGSSGANGYHFVYGTSEIVRVCSSVTDKSNTTWPYVWLAPTVSEKTKSTLM